MTSSTTTFDVSTWLAKRSVEASEIGEPGFPEFVALPGAREAIQHDRLLAHQDNGRAEHEIVQRINAAWARKNGAVLDEHAEWAQGPYADALREARERAAQKAARELRRQAALERLADEAGAE